MTDFVDVLDRSRRPDVCQSRGADAFGRWIVDFFPESLPSVGPFNNERDAHSAVIETVGEPQHKLWFPDFYDGRARQTCSGCGAWVTTTSLRTEPLIGVGLYCCRCRGILAAKSTGRAALDDYLGLLDWASVPEEKRLRCASVLSGLALSSPEQFAVVSVFHWINWRHVPVDRGRAIARILAE